MGQSITSEAKFRQRVIKYSNKNGVTKASSHFHCSRQVIYNWRKRYDGKSWKSLIEHSHKPKSHPKEHRAEEIELILRYYPYYKNDTLLLWQKIREKGNCRSYKVMLRKLNSLLKESDINVNINMHKRGCGYFFGPRTLYLALVCIAAGLIHLKIL